MFNPVVPYRYLLPTMYMFMVDITDPDLFACSCRTWICPDITRFYEELRQVWTQFAQQFVTAGTAPPFVDYVIWSLDGNFFTIMQMSSVTNGRNYLNSWNDIR